MTIDVVILIFAVIWLSIAVSGFWVWLRNRLKWEDARRYRYLTRYKFDQLGNPEYFYDPSTEQSFVPESGNKAFPELAIQPEIKHIPTGKRQPEIFVQKLPLEQYAALQEASKELPSPQKVRSHEETLNLLQEGIEQNLGKTRTLQQMFNIHGGPEFTRLGKIYDKLAGKE
jgi:hypothetical protein